MNAADYRRLLVKALAGDGPDVDDSADVVSFAFGHLEGEAYALTCIEQIAEEEKRAVAFGAVYGLHGRIAALREFYDREVHAKRCQCAGEQASESAEVSR